MSLRGIDAHLEVDALALVDAGSRGIALDLAIHVTPRAPPGNFPIRRPRLLVLQNDGITLSHRREGNQSYCRNQIETNSPQQRRKYASVLKLPLHDAPFYGT